jgi:hypothetical protein
MIEKDFDKASNIYLEFLKWLEEMEVQSVFDEKSSKRVKQLRELAKNKFDKVLIAANELTTLMGKELNIKLWEELMEAEQKIINYGN